MSFYDQHNVMNDAPIPPQCQSPSRNAVRLEPDFVLFSCSCLSLFRANISWSPVFFFARGFAWFSSEGKDRAALGVKDRDEYEDVDEVWTAIVGVEAEREARIREDEDVVDSEVAAFASATVFCLGRYGGGFGSGKCCDC